MRIEKGHYVPKELITSAAIHEAVIAAFVAAGFIDARKPLRYGCYDNTTPDAGLWVTDGDNDVDDDVDDGFIMNLDHPKYAKSPLTLQELFTAENGLVWPERANSIIYDGHGVFFSGLGFFRLISGAAGESVVITALATRQRPKNDPLNGYKWGVEYQCNGVKPDLPDDVLIDIKCETGRNVWQGNEKLMVKGVGWNLDQCNIPASHFKIIDERYKPADAPAAEPAQPDDEYEPDIDELCEYTLSQRGEIERWYECTVIAKQKLVLECPHLANDCCSGLQVVDRSKARFRKVSAERNAEQERKSLITIAALDVLQPPERGEYQLDIIGRLIDKGWRPTK